MKRILSALALLTMCAVCSMAAVVDTVEIATRHLTTPMKVSVVTPTTGAEGERFPTVYMLNGHGGDYRSWLKSQKRLRELSDRYKMVFVFPDGRNSWYWDTPKMRMESFFVEDLVPYIDANFPTRADAVSRAITGYSMGGHGALWLASRHPDLWRSAGSMSGGVDIRPFPKNWNMPELLGAEDNNPGKWAQHTVITQVPNWKPGELNLIIDCGTEDVFTEVNENLHRELLRHKIPHDYTSRPGAHNWNYWNNSIYYHLLFFSEVFRKGGK